MKKCLAIAALLLAGASRAGSVHFEYGGRNLSASTLIAGFSVLDTRRPRQYREPPSAPSREDKRLVPEATPQEAKTDTKTDPQPLRRRLLRPLRPNKRRRSLAPAAPPAPAATAAEPSTDDRAVAPADTTTAPSGPQASPDIAPSPAKSAPAPTVATVPPAPASAPAPVAIQVAKFLRLAFGLTEEKEGKVRLAQCGVNLWLCRRQEIEPEWRAGADHYWPGKDNGAVGSSIRTAAAPTILHDRAVLRHLARPGLRLWRRVLRRARPGRASTERLSGCDAPDLKALASRGLYHPCDGHHGAISGDVRPCPRQNTRGPVKRDIFASQFQPLAFFCSRRW